MTDMETTMVRGPGLRMSGKPGGLHGYREQWGLLTVPVNYPPKVPYGNGAVWNFNKDSTTYDYWVNALLWPSAGYMTNLREFLGTIEWWNLVPAHELVRNQEQADSLKMVVSKNNDYSMIVAYMPDNPTLVLNMREFIGSYFTAWYNPKTGHYQTAEKITGGLENQIFRRPDGWEDAVLKITRVMSTTKSTGW